MSQLLTLIQLLPILLLEQTWLTSIDKNPTLGLGNYEVDTDINLGAYQVDPYFTNEDYRMGSGSGKVVITTSAKDGSNSDFHFSFDN